MSYPNEEMTHFSECQNLENKSSKPERFVSTERNQLTIEVQFTVFERIISLYFPNLYSQF